MTESNAQLATDVACRVAILPFRLCVRQGTRRHSVLGLMIRVRHLLRPQRDLHLRVLVLSIHEPQELRVNVVRVDAISESLPSPGSARNRFPVASTVHRHWSSCRSNKTAKSDLHAAATTAELERKIKVSPNITPNLCVRLRLDLDFVAPVVAPSGAIPSANAALAYSDKCWQSGDYDRCRHNGTWSVSRSLSPPSRRMTGKGCMTTTDAWRPATKESVAVMWPGTQW